MFAEKQRSELMDLIEKNKNYQPTPVIPSAVPTTFGKALLEIGKKYLVDEIKSIDFHADGCNILITSDWGTYWYRNPYCQPPPQLPPPPPREGSFYVGGICNCGIAVTFAFYQATGQLMVGGAGIAHCLFDGTTCPDTLWFQPQSGSSSGDDPRSRFESYDPNLRIYFRLPFTVIDGKSIGDGIYLIYCTVYFSLEEVQSGNGFVSPNLPRLLNYGIPISTAWTTVEKHCIGCEPNIYIAPPPPPPPPPKDCDCMTCCCPQQKYDDTLLKLILKRIGQPKTVEIFDEDLTRTGAQKTNKTPQSLNEYFKLAVERVEIANRIIGIENFPVTVSDTVIEPHKEGVFASIFKFIDGDKKIKINSVTEFVVWMAKQDSAVLGEFHQVIQSETGKKDKKGKPIISTIVLPNVAESLKEIVLLTAQMAKQGNTQTELLFKMAAEIIATRAAATKGTTISQDIQDYLDYPTNTKKASVKTAVSLPTFSTNKEGIPVATGESESHENFLKSGKIDYVYDDWTGSNSLHDQLLDLLQLASMLRAIYFQRTDRIESEIE